MTDDRHALGRRDLLAAMPLLAALPQLLAAGQAEAGPDPRKTFVKLAKDIVFEPQLGDRRTASSRPTSFRNPPSLGSTSTSRAGIPAT